MENGTKQNPSLIASMNNFVRAVENMDSTVLLPSRLMDMSANNANSSQKDDKIPEDLYAFYKMLNGMKEELVLGPNVVNIDCPEDGEKCLQNFRYHLQGLTQCLRDLTKSTNLVTSRYQEELGDGNKRASPTLTY